MKTGMRLKTRHEEGFHLCGDNGPLDPSRSPYGSLFGVEVYMAKCTVLHKHVGTSQFLWCISASRSFLFYEKQKPIEWCIDMEPSRVLGYVKKDLWSEFLTGKQIEPDEFFSRTNKWKDGEIDVLVAYPVRQYELMSRTVFDIRDTDDASVIQKEVFQDSLSAS